MGYAPPFLSKLESLDPSCWNFNFYLRIKVSVCKLWKLCPEWDIQVYLQESINLAIFLLQEIFMDQSGVRSEEDWMNNLVNFINF